MVKLNIKKIWREKNGGGNRDGNKMVIEGLEKETIYYHTWNCCVTTPPIMGKESNDISL